MYVCSNVQQSQNEVSCRSCTPREESSHCTKNGRHVPQEGGPSPPSRVTPVASSGYLVIVEKEGAGDEKNPINGKTKRRKKHVLTLINLPLFSLPTHSSSPSGATRTRHTQKKKKSPWPLAYSRKTRISIRRIEIEVSFVGGCGEVPSFNSLIVVQGKLKRLLPLMTAQCM